jgi:two-component system sensor histidine kinase QseC
MTSLRLRLLGIIGVSLLALWSLVAVWMFVDLRSEMRTALDDRLAASARMVAGLVAQLPATPAPLSGLAGSPVDVVARDGLACEVSLLRGEVMIQTLARTAASPGLADLAPGYSTRAFGGKLWRTFVLQQGGVRVATADRLDIREALLRDIALAAGIPFAVALAGSLLLLWFAIGRGLAPIERVRKQLAQRRPDDDRPLAPIPVPAELRPLVDTIRHLLERVQGAIARERRFTDDAAHELRTPLTAVKTHLQVMRLAADRGQAGAALPQALAQAGEGVQRMQRTLEQLLLLARLDGQVEGAGSGGADALAAARQAAQDAEAGQGSPGRVRLTGAQLSMTVAVPDVLLVSALRNLLDNALRFAPAVSFVALEVERIADQARFTVLDEGPGLSEAECRVAVERFWRRDRSPQGSGLGLSIVSTIAMRYGGQLRLAPRAEGGLRAELTLPVQSGN